MRTLALINIFLVLRSTRLITTSAIVTKGSHKVRATTAMDNCKVPDDLQKSIYGDTKHADFPASLPKGEAGTCTNGQRRYLWTDAFGIANYLSQAMKHNDKRNENLEAARKLIDSVFDGLGQPTSPRYPMAQRDPTSANAGYKGLRIGKTDQRTQSDFGMKYDGMYWHYIDKFLFVLARYAKISGDTTYLNKAVQLAQECHAAFCVPTKGYHWKLNTDMTPIAGCPDVRPSHDAVSAWVVYNIIMSMGGELHSEVDDLGPIVGQYFSRPVSKMLPELMDPLGLGTHLWTMQWLGARCCAGTVATGEYQAAAKVVAKRVLQQSYEELRVGYCLPFRLYGALLGAEVTSDTPELQQSAHKMAEAAMPIHWEQEDTWSDAGLTSINTVMLATALNPESFKIMEGETNF